MLGSATSSGLWAGDGGEGAKFWLSVLTEIKNRGTTGVCIVVCDGLKGLPEAVNTVWDRAVIQTCVIHYPDTWIMPIPRVFSLVGAVSALRMLA